jgi:hypothetical protein
MDPQVLGRLGEVPAVALHDPGDEPFLELSLGVGEPDSLVDHLDDECIQLLLHGSTFSDPRAGNFGVPVGSVPIRGENG